MIPAGTWLLNYTSYGQDGGPIIWTWPPGFTDFTFLVDDSRIGDLISSQSIMISTPTAIEISWELTSVPLLSVNANQSIQILPAMNATVNPQLNAGLVRKIRPVAMSLFVTYEGSNQWNGGSIACARIPADTCTSNFYTNNAGSQPGQLQDWDKVAGVGDGITKYNGRLENGCYCWWLPDSAGANDTKLLLPSENAKHAFPCLIVSGQYQYPAPDVSGVYTPPTIRVIFNIIWEFSHLTSLWKLETYLGSDMEMSQAMNFCFEHDFACANADHLKVLKRIFSTIGKFGKSALMWAANNPATISKGIMTAASFLV